MNFDVLDPPVIPVDLAVSRCEPNPEDGSAFVWGHVGDYEVSICLPLDDPRIRALLAAKKPVKTRRDGG